MSANVINSPRAAEISVHVVRAFVRLLDMVFTHKELSCKFVELERNVSSYGQAITALNNAIRQLMAPSVMKKKRPIGFAPW